MIPVRTIPPYVRSVDWDDEPTAPSAGHVNRERPKPRYIPDFRPRPQQPGHKFDHLRSRTPPIFTPLPGELSRWISFASPVTGGPPRRKLSDEEKAQAELILSRYGRPHTIDEDAALKESDRDLRKLSFSKRSKVLLLQACFYPETNTLLQNFFLKSPFMPLIFRLINLTFSVASLGLSGFIFHKLHRSPSCSNGASTYMALIVDTVAVPYVVWITYDEFNSPPIGIRPPHEKLRLIFLDLIFIIFDAANTSLAFQALSDPSWACEKGGTCQLQGNVCERQKALAALLLVALLAWTVGFIVSLIRLVGRVADR